MITNSRFLIIRGGKTVCKTLTSLNWFCFLKTFSYFFRQHCACAKWAPHPHPGASFLDRKPHRPEAARCPGGREGVKLPATGASSSPHPDPEPPSPVGGPRLPYFPDSNSKSSRQSDLSHAGSLVEGNLHQRQMRVTSGPSSSSCQSPRPHS